MLMMFTVAGTLDCSLGLFGAQLRGGLGVMGLFTCRFVLCAWTGHGMFDVFGGALDNLGNIGSCE